MVAREDTRIRFMLPKGCSDLFHAPGMTSRRPAGCAARRREDWPSCQAARRSLRAFWTPPRRFDSTCGGHTVCAPRFAPPSRHTTRMPSPPVQTEARIQCG